MLRKERLDIISVCTWPENHAEIVAAAAAASVKGILCEKPLALQLSKVEEMLAVCARHNCKLAGGHQYRFHPAFSKAARLIREGRLGTLRTAKGNITSCLANNGPHLIDAVRFILGDARVLSVECTCERSRDEWNRGMPVELASRSLLLARSKLMERLQTIFGLATAGRRNLMTSWRGLRAKNRRTPPMQPRVPRPFTS